MKVLIACEESQRVCIEFRKKGHEAYSCDILDCSGGHPEWHIKDDALNVMYGNGIFMTEDRILHKCEEWDLIIAHPPCTYLSVAGNSWYDVSKYGEKAIKRRERLEHAIIFFMNIALNPKCKKMAIENPIGRMSTYYRKPDQIIHPYMFGDPERKATCLWLKGLPKLKPTNTVDPVIIKYKKGTGTDSPWHMNTIGLPKEERQKQRSKTFPGIAKAMADQWG